MRVVVVVVACSSVSVEFQLQRAATSGESGADDAREVVDANVRGGPQI